MIQQGDEEPSPASEYVHHDQTQSEHLQENRKQVFRGILKSTVVIFLLMTGEFIGGGISNSIAVISDAAHLLVDVLSFGATLIFLTVSDRSPTDQYSFGLKRVEVIGSLLTMNILWIISGIICYESSMRIVSVVNHPNNTVIVDGMVMCVTAIASTVCNLLILFLLHPPKSLGGHGHSHGDVNHANVSAHTLSHMVNSTGMILAGALIWAYPASIWWSVQLADPITSIVVNVAGLLPTIPTIIDCLGILMQKYPHEVSKLELLTKLKGIKGVESLHALHVWELTEGHIIATVHITILPDYDPMTVLKQSQETLHTLGVRYATVQVENQQCGYQIREPQIV